MSNLEAIRAAHARAMRARLRDEPMTGAEVERRDNPVWRLRLCDWCGVEYEAPRVRFGANPGKSRQYCSPECKDHADAMSRGISNRRPEKRVRDKHAKSIGRQNARLDARFERLSHELGRGEWFIAKQAAFVWVVSADNARLILERLKERGLIRCRKRLDGTGGGGHGRMEWKIP